MRFKINVTIKSYVLSL